MHARQLPYASSGRHLVAVVANDQASLLAPPRAIFVVSLSHLHLIKPDLLLCHLLSTTQ